MQGSFQRVLLARVVGAGRSAVSPGLGRRRSPWEPRLADEAAHFHWFFGARCGDGEAAIREWGEWSPRLILMDVHMPVMDGLEATRRIKSEARGKETAIVVLTASALDQDRRSVAESGADDFVAKPCREDELLEKMCGLLHIAYDYGEAGGSDGQPLPGSAALSAERLGRFPLELLEELRAATLSGSKRGLDNLIVKARETEDAASADALQVLADKYEYDALTRLLDAARRP